MKVKVTKKHLKLALKDKAVIKETTKYCEACLVAQAVKDALPELKNFNVSYTEIFRNVSNKKLYDLKNAEELVIAFDDISTEKNKDRTNAIIKCANMLPAVIELTPVTREAA